MISEFQVLTSNYDAQYGSAGGVTIENVRSGTSNYHGSVFEFHRDTALNATQWGIAASDKAQDIENDFGGNFGGPLKLPFWKDQNHRTFFFANFEAFRIRGALTRPTLSIPSLAERQGDFRDWGSPIYDPATHQQFMGCDGNTPNVICPPILACKIRLPSNGSSFFLIPLLPVPRITIWLPPSPPSWARMLTASWKRSINTWAAKDHISEMFYYKYLPPTTFTSLPEVISDSGTTFKRTSVLRVNWDHTFGPNTVNHTAFGFQNDKAYGGGIDGKSADKLPQIPGVASHEYPPVIRFDGEFEGFGTGAGDPNIQPWLAPAWIVNDAVSMTRGKHTISFGGEMRIAQNSATFLGGQSGSFDFARGETGIIDPATGDLVGGSPIASFLLEQVDNLPKQPFTQAPKLTHAPTVSCCLWAIPGGLHPN